MEVRCLAASTAALAAALAGPALAAGPVPVVEEPMVTPPAALATPATDWTGFYAGGQIGWAWARGDGRLDEPDDLDIDLDANGVIGGLTGGYRYDFGQWVVGGEVQYDWADTEFDEIDFGDVALEIDDEGRINDIWRIKGTAGYDFGATLVYGSVGWAQASVDVGDEDYDGDGWVVGAGFDYLLTDSVSVGGEFMYHQFDDFGDEGENFDLDATTLQGKVTFRF
jgi:outer membrane immunogenic protein